MSTIIDKVLRLLEREKKPMTPTEIGMTLGYDYDHASSKVAPALRRLLAEGRIRRHREGRRVTYEVVRGPEGEG